MTLKSSIAPLNGVVLAAVALVLSACAAGPNTLDNPVLRKFQWFSYLEGGDFKATCTPGSSDRYRLVYNGIYTEHVRTYDLRADTGKLDVHLILPVDLSNFTVQDFPDLFNPWQGKKATRQLDGAQVAAIVGALDADGAFGPPALGLELPSMGFFWSIASCHKGAYHFTGLAWPSDDWDAATFPGALAAVDPIKDPLNPPRKTYLWRTTRRGHLVNPNTQNDFVIEVGKDGLTGFGPLF
jgi:hypothetical protein